MVIWLRKLERLLNLFYFFVFLGHKHFYKFWSELLFTTIFISGSFNKYPGILLRELDYNIRLKALCPLGAKSHRSWKNGMGDTHLWHSKYEKHARALPHILQGLRSELV